MKSLLRLLPVVVLAVLLAGVGGVGSARAQGAAKLVGPGESIQKAVNAADPGDTIVVRGVHREDVVIRKNGIKLRGIDNAVIEAPPRAKADSPCSKLKGPEGICVLGDGDIKTGEVNKRVRDVSVSGFTFRGFEIAGNRIGKTYVIEVFAARNVTVVENRATGNVAGGIIASESINATIANNELVGNPKGNVQGIAVGAVRNTKIVNNVVRRYAEGVNLDPATNTTISSNDLTDNNLGMLVIESTGTKILSNDITDSTLVGTVIFESTGTKILSNDISRSGETGILIFGPQRANNDAKVVGNNISGGAWGMYVDNTKGGFIAANTIHDNCAGMFFEATGFDGGPVSGSEVKANTVEDNTRSCRGPKFGRKFSGIGIALLGARDMEVTGNQLSGNVPSGPTPVSGGVVVATDPFFGETIKPKNNTVTGNHFGRNKPDIFYDKSGTGNRFAGNLCDTSVPSRLCN